MSIRTYVITVHLPRVGSGLNGRALIFTPSGELEQRTISDWKVGTIEDVTQYAIELVGVMYPGVKNKIHGTVELVTAQSPENSAQLHTVAVDVDGPPACGNPGPNCIEHRGECD